MVPSDNETWLIEVGHDILVKKSEQGEEALSAIERLVRCVWAADYSMRNAGDLRSAEDLYAPFQMEAWRIADELGLPDTRSTFSLSSEALERSYIDVFDHVCDELRTSLSG